MHHRTRLPHALATLYAFAIVYASLQPFGDWIEPAPGTPFDNARFELIEEAFDAPDVRPSEPLVKLRRKSKA